MTVGLIEATVTPIASRARRRLGLLAAVGVLVLVVALSLTLGTRATSIETVVAALFSPVTGNTDHSVVRDLRIPRTVIGLVVGAALALVAVTLLGVVFGGVLSQY